MKKRRGWREGKKKNIEDVMKNSADRILKISVAVNRDIQRLWRELFVV
jgi:predicted ribosome quality control (RQC) complex YloA/Tae2 family protein